MIVIILYKLVNNIYSNVYYNGIETFLNSRNYSLQIEHNINE